MAADVLVSYFAGPSPSIVSIMSDTRTCDLHEDVVCVTLVTRDNKYTIKT